MCGNWGMITETNTKDTRDFMKQGLYIDALRGMDSTGLLTVDSLGEVIINKKAITALDFINLKQVEKQIDDHLNRVFIGHNRAATRGAVNNNNAHPFTHGKISLVHNGSLNVTHNLIDNRMFSVDSENIAYSFDKVGVHETLKLLQGAFALVWWDHEEKRVKMARNSQRPLTIATIEDKNTVIWGSESSMLRYVAGRSGLKISELWTLPENTIASFDPKSKDIWNCEIEEDVEYYKYHYPARNDAGFPHQTRTQNSASNQKGGNASNQASKTKGKEVEEALKKRDLLSTRMFERAGMKKGEQVSFWLYDFEPFNSKYPDSQGIWQGCTSNDPFVTVAVYGHCKGDYDEGEEYTGEALCMQPIELDQVGDSLTNYRLVIDNTTIEDVVDEDTPVDTDEYAETTIILKDEKSEKPKTTSEKKAIVAKLLEETEEKIKRERAEKEIPSKKRSILTISGKIEAESDGDSENSADVDFLFLTGPRGLAIPSDEWYALTKNGCGMCCRDLRPDEAKDLQWWGDTGRDPVCPECIVKCTSDVDEAIHNLH